MWGTSTGGMRSCFDSEREKESLREKEGLWCGGSRRLQCGTHNQLDYLMLSVRAALRIAHADKQTESADADAETTENRSRSRSHHERDTATVRVSVTERGGVNNGDGNWSAQSTRSQSVASRTETRNDKSSDWFSCRQVRLPVSVSLGKRSAWKAVPTLARAAFVNVVSARTIFRLDFPTSRRAN